MHRPIKSSDDWALPSPQKKMQTKSIVRRVQIREAIRLLRNLDILLLLFEYALYQLLIHQIRFRDMIPVGMRPVKFGDGTHGVRVACPRAAGYTSHHVPEHGRTQNLIDAFAAVAHHAEASVDGFADAHASSVMQRYEAHPAGAVAGEALYGHVGHHITTVLDVRGLAEGGVGAAHVMMVAAEHNGADLSLAYHLVKLQCDGHPSYGILIEDTRLCAYH